MQEPLVARLTPEGPLREAGAATETAAETATAARATSLADCLAEISALPGVDADTCRWLGEKLAASAFNLVVAGQFKRGKSSLINALLGEAVLPVGVVPLTSVVTLIEYGTPPCATIEFENGERRPVPLDALEEYATERGNPGNAKGVDRVRVSYPSAWLARDVRLIDTPGIDSAYEHNTQVTRRFIPQADAVIFVASVDQPLSRAELDFLQSVQAYASRIFCVLNKTDLLTPAELQESTAFAAEYLHRALGAPTAVFPVSARRALPAGATADSAGAVDDPAAGSEGFAQLQRALQRFMRHDRHAVWRHSVVATLRRLLSQVRFGLDLERSALAKPLDQLEQAMAALRAEKKTAQRAQFEHAVLLQAQATALLRDRVEPELTRFKEEQKVRIVGMLGEWYRQCRAATGGGIQARLEQRLVEAIRAAYDDWVARQEPVVARAFDELCNRFWKELQTEIDALLGRCGALFGVSFDPVATASVWQSESRFDYRFWTEPPSVAALSAAILGLLPAALAGPVLLRRLRVRAEDLVELHAGRLRSDLERRLQSSVEDFRRRLTQHLHVTIERIERAIGRGIDRFSADRLEVTERQQALAAVGARIDRLEAQLRELSAAHEESSADSDSSRRRPEVAS